MWHTEQYLFFRLSVFASLENNLELGSREIHIWSFALDGADAQVDRLYDILSADELKRAQKLKFERDRNRFVATRAALRSLLGKYLQQAPEQFAFSCGEHGKPQIPGIEFNVSHTEALAVFAFSINQPLGIDIEHGQRELDYQRLALRFFSSRENELLQETEIGIRKKAFLRLWTRKEALLKATGEGISRKLNQVDVSGSVCRIASLDQTQESAWSLYDIDVGSDYVGALSAQGERHRLIHYHL